MTFDAVPIFFYFSALSSVSVSALNAEGLVGRFSFFVEFCPNRYGAVIVDIQTFLKGLNASDNLQWFQCNNPFALSQAAHSSYSGGIRHMVLAASSPVLDLFSRMSFPSGATFKYTDLDDHLFMYPWNGPNHLIPLFQSILLKWKWKNVYFYIDPYYGLSFHSNVNSPDVEREPYSVEQLSLVDNCPPPEFVSLLKGKDVRHVRSIVVVADAFTTLDLMQSASDEGLLTSEYQWMIFFNGNLNDLNGRLKLRENTRFYVARRSGGETGNAGTSMIDYLSSEVPKPNESDYALSNLKMGGTTKVDVLRLHPNEMGSVYTRLVAKWDPKDGFSSLYVSRYLNYQGRALRVATMESPPYVIIEKDSEGRPMYSGYLVDLLQVVASLLNFTIEYIPVKNSVEVGLGNSTWNGIIEALTLKKADVGLYDLAVTPDRLRLVDFAQVAVDSQATAGLFRRPGSDGEGMDKFGVYLEPFHLHVWIASIVAIFVLVASLYFSTWLTKRLSEAAGIDWENDPIDVSRVVLLGFQAVAQQGSELNFGNPSTRIIFVVLWFFALICYASYSATLMSYLTVTRIIWPFSSLTTLARNKDFRIGFMEGSSHLEMFRESSSPVYRAVWNRVVAARLATIVSDYSEGLNRVYGEKYVLLSDDKTMQYVTRNTCDLVVSEPLTSPHFVTLAFQKDSPHEQAVSRVLRYMNDAGIMYRLHDKWWGTGMFCQQEAQMFMSLSLTNVATGFLIVVAGILVGGLALTVEGMLVRFGCRKMPEKKKEVRLNVGKRFGQPRPRIRLHY